MGDPAVTSATAVGITGALMTTGPGWSPIVNHEWTLDLSDAEYPRMPTPDKIEDYNLTIGAFNGAWFYKPVLVRVGWTPKITGPRVLYLENGYKDAVVTRFNIQSSLPLEGPYPTGITYGFEDPDTESKFHFAADGTLTIDPGLPPNSDGYKLELNASNAFGSDAYSQEAFDLLVRTGDAPVAITGPALLNVPAGDAATATYEVNGGTDPYDVWIEAPAALRDKLTVQRAGSVATLHVNTAGVTIGAYKFKIHAHNFYGADKVHEVRLNVGNEPSLTGSATIALKSGYAATTQQYTVTGVPTSAEVTGLPVAATFTTTGALTIPAGLAPGAYNATLAAENGRGRGSLKIKVTVSGTSLAKATLAKAIPNKAWTGSQIKPAVSVKLGTVTLNKDVDYTVSYGTNKSIGKGTVKITGQGSYTGTKTFNFKITPKKVSLKKVTAGKRQFKATWTKLSAAQKISRYQLRYRIKGTWKVKTLVASKASLTVKKLTKGKKYQVQVRAYKTVSGVKYYGAWSSVKTSTKIK
jgi:hypothetical protein